MTDLFIKEPTQKEKVYNFIKANGRVFTHELNRWGDDHTINCSGTRARELKAEGRIWRVSKQVMLSIAPDSREEMWSVYEADRELTGGL